MFKGVRFVVLLSLCKELLHKVREGHQGIGKCKFCACEALYWPGMITDITKMKLAKKFQNKQQREPLLPDEVSELPWQKVGADLFMWESKEYLLVLN